MPSAADALRLHRPYSSRVRSLRICRSCSRRSSSWSSTHRIVRTLATHVARPRQRGDRMNLQGNVTQQLILKRASASRPSSDWNDDDFDVLADRAPLPFVYAARQNDSRDWGDNERVIPGSVRCPSVCRHAHSLSEGGCWAEPPILCPRDILALASGPNRPQPFLI